MPIIGTRNKQKQEITKQIIDIFNKYFCGTKEKMENINRAKIEYKFAFALILVHIYAHLYV